MARSAWPDDGGRRRIDDLFSIVTLPHVRKVAPAGHRAGRVRELRTTRSEYFAFRSVAVRCFSGYRGS